VRGLELDPRVSVAWAPARLRDTKFSAGYGIFHDAVSLGILARAEDQFSLATFFPAGGGPPLGPVTTAFFVNDRLLKVPQYQNVSVNVERKLPFDFYARAGYLHRAGAHAFTFVPGPLVQFPATAMSYDLRNGRRDRYDAFDVSVRRTFAGQYEWFGGYTRSSARSNAAVDYSLENPVFAPQMPGPFSWDAPDRFHMWGWAPLPKRLLPRRLRFVIHDTSVAYLAEYRTGFPFGVVSEDGYLVGRPNSRRYPGYFNVNLHLERKFRALHYLWAWRFGFNNLTNNGNPNTVNNVLQSPWFLTYGRGQARAFTVRLRLLGRK
jgi:hypothetical protein